MFDRPPTAPRLDRRERREGPSLTPKRPAVDAFEARPQPDLVCPRSLSLLVWLRKVAERLSVLLSVPVTWQRTTKKVRAAVLTAEDPLGRWRNR